MSAATATVEVLTAEVRVLMVGSRQVTMSVAKQLDFADITLVEPFGRIAPPVDVGSDKVVIIGRHRTDGTLVRAVSSRPYPPPVVEKEDLNPDLPEKPTLCRAWGASRRLFFHDTEIAFRSGAYQECGIDGHWLGGENRCEHWHDNGHAPEIEAVIAEWRAQRDTHRRMRELPLIVLAGLR